jgi:hypothetical protein
MAMNPNFQPLRKLFDAPGYTTADYVVLVGELFGKGYANGIVEAAKKRKLKVIGTTVGRRSPEGELRPLNAEELVAARALADFDHFINVPLEAGFDLEKASDGTTLVDQFAKVKLDGWDQVKLNWDPIEKAKESGVKRFRNSIKELVKSLESIIPKSSQVLFVHTMAGGLPRAKIFMPTFNKVFKGRGDRFISSDYFWKTDMGRLSELSFNEVTADTFRHLVEETSSFHSRAHYVAYGYHGTEIVIDNEYKWQSYSPYLQGFAKMRLEDISKEKFKAGLKTCVFNSPEILTNSSNLFQGVELPLYALFAALRKEAPKSRLLASLENMAIQKLKDEVPLDQVIEYCNEVIGSKHILGYCDFQSWPQHSAKEQMQFVLESSDKIFAFHKNENDTMALELSRVIFESTGESMFTESWNPSAPVLWLGHDILSKVAVKIKE